MNADPKLKAPASPPPPPPGPAPKMHPHTALRVASLLRDLARQLDSDDGARHDLALAAGEAHPLPAGAAPPTARHPMFGDAAGVLDRAARKQDPRDLAPFFPALHDLVGRIAAKA